MGRVGSGLKVQFGDDIDVKLRARARLLAMQKENERRYAAGAKGLVRFAREAAFTMDQRGGDRGTDVTGIRQYPVAAMTDACCDPPLAGVCRRGGCRNYLEHVLREWHGNPRTLWPKSRRLLMSWTLVIAHYWLARYRPASLIGFATRKHGDSEEEGSAELVKRCKIIHEHLPPFVLKRPVKYTLGKFSFLDNESTILAIAQGADQARQYTYTAYLADEFAFWEQAAATYAALYPTLEGGGRFTGVSSAGPGFMQQLVFDTWLTEGG